jgi:hypothetical protein
LSTDRIVIRIIGVEDLSIAVTMLAAAGARRIGRSRSFAVEGPRLTAMQAYGISYLAREEGVSVEPREIPNSWTVEDGDVDEPEWMNEHQAEAWWTRSMKQGTPP